MSLTALGGVLSLAVLLTAFWFLSQNQRSTAVAARRAHDDAQAMLVGLLEQERGLDDFATRRDAWSLELYERGRREFERKQAAIRLWMRDDSVGSTLLATSSAAARTWQRAAERSLRRLRATRTVSENSASTDAVATDLLLDTFRSDHTTLMLYLDQTEERSYRRGWYLTVAVMSVLATMLCAGLIFAVKTRHRRALRRRDQRREFVSAIQTAESETEVCGLLVRQLARAVPKADIIVPLRRNASDDRLESRASSLPSELARELQDADPRDCLAVRTGQPHTQQRKSEALLVCRLCSAAAGHTYCVPSLVGGQVIGAVLVGSERPVLPADQDELLASVEQAAPVLGNLRTLAIAEVRAQTDPLTGLANRREAIDTLHRMVAHAIRNATPLTALMIDIDHFKRLNDEYGHDAGDAALAAVTDTLRARLRGSDFAARWGGEEFLVLLPETEREGGVQVAEHMRESVARLTLPDRRVSLTASFGVAELPTDGPDADDLIRAADRALYAAKQAGRNRVAAVSPPDPEALTELAL